MNTLIRKKNFSKLRIKNNQDVNLRHVLTKQTSEDSSPLHGADVIMPFGAGGLVAGPRRYPPLVRRFAAHWRGDEWVLQAPLS